MPLGQSARPCFEDVALAELAVLYRVARRLTLDDAWAEDLVGQTFLQAAKAWPSFDGRFPRSWLISILRNVYRRDVRQSARGPVSVPLEVAEPVGNDHSDDLIWRVVGERIHIELDRLPEEYRLAISLCDVENLSYDEAAEAMGVPAGTVKSRLWRGRRLLRQRLTALQPETR